MNQNREVGRPFKTFLTGSIAQNCYMFFLFSLCPLLIYRPAFQNDTYWLINTGKYIVNHGFPVTEPFTIHQGLSFIAQQWLSTILFHISYEMGGEAGVHSIVIITCALTLFLTYRTAVQLSKGNRLIAAYVTAFIGVCLSSFMVPRPQVFSLFVFVSAVALLEYHICNRKKTMVVVIFLTLTSALLINLHAAMWPVLFLLYIPYFLDSIKFKFGGIEGQGYPVKPLVFAFLLSFLAGFANPYGFRSMTYLLDSYGNNVINSHVQEMFSPDFKSLSGLFMFAIVAAVISIYFLMKGSTRLRYVILTLGTLYMGLSSVRSFSLFVIFGIVFLAFYLKGVDLSSAMPARRRTVLITIAILIMFAARISHIHEYAMIEEDIKPEAAVMYMKRNIDLPKMRLYNSYETGGYIEFSGIRAFIDSRAEVFIKKLNKKDDIFVDYCKALAGELYYSDLIAKYAFSHLLVKNNDLMCNCLKHDGMYRAIFRDSTFILYERMLPIRAGEQVR